MLLREISTYGSQEYCCNGNTNNGSRTYNLTQKESIMSKIAAVQDMPLYKER
jgi:hypothetical protein